ncbi:adenylate/guanylate cyclase domain-containing protein [Sulfitobacter sp. MF3-043]|uniref:adenylate/guanylate cyclase domain-containing protein n=1 Tax=Sulfitobacter sediminivivens TaxID=3252902 RepID=UPI0036DD6327
MADPFTPSPELAAIATRWIKAYSARRSVAAANLLSSSKALTYIGSDEGELFKGDTLRETFEKYSDDQAVLLPENIQATGYEAGDFGWAYTTLTIYSPEANLRVAFRNTFIFTMEDGVWRIVHIHNSNPKPNLEAMGYELGRFEDLLVAARAERVESTQTGIASVMFTDIVDSTALASAAGDHRWNRIVTEHIGSITQQIQTEGGTMVKSLGDGTLSTFASAGAAMRTAIAIQRGMVAQTDEPKLRIRIEIHTGDVIQNEGDFVGTVVNKAARVAATCDPGNIRVSEATRVMVGDADGFNFVDPVEVPLKGLKGEHLIHSLAW